jgi:lysophospholipase L1-like esterase
MALYEVLRAPMRVWYSRMLGHAPLVPSPRTGPFIGSTAPEADRVLLVGNGPMHGWGVLTHELSLVGHLARALRRRTSREVGVDFVGDERMTVRSAGAWVGDRAGQGHDLAIIAIGMNDALRLTPVRQFAEDYRALVNQVRADLPDHGRIALITVPHVRSYAMAQGWLGRAAELHAARLTRAIRAAAINVPGTHVIDAPQEHFERDAPLGSREFFEDLATQVVADVAAVLETARAGRHVDPAAFVLSPARVLAATVDPALEGLVTRAREAFGVSVASVNLIDGDRVWSAATAGSLPPQLPTALVYCGIVATTDAELVVPDRHAEARFDGNPILDVVGLPFYTGVPLHDRSGTVIGTLCVLDDNTHPVDYVPLPALRRMAAEAEARVAELAAAAAKAQAVPGAGRSKTLPRVE